MKKQDARNKIQDTGCKRITNVQKKIYPRITQINTNLKNKATETLKVTTVGN